MYRPLRFPNILVGIFPGYLGMLFTSSFPEIMIIPTGKRGLHLAGRRTESAYFVTAGYSDCSKPIIYFA